MNRNIGARLMLDFNIQGAAVGWLSQLKSAVLKPGSQSFSSRGKSTPRSGIDWEFAEAPFLKQGPRIHKNICVNSILLLVVKRKMSWNAPRVLLRMTVYKPGVLCRCAECPLALFVSQTQAWNGKAEAKRVLLTCRRRELTGSESDICLHIDVAPVLYCLLFWCVCVHACGCPFVDDSHSKNGL